MSKRIKVQVNVPTVNSLEEADVILSEIAARKRSIDLINAGLNEEIDNLKVKAAAETAPIAQEITILEQGLARFAEAHKGELFTKTRSREMAFGEMGFRASSKVALLSRKWSWERVLTAIKEQGLTDCIRTKEEVDKEALRSLNPEALKEVGVKIQPSDTFFYELKEETVGAEA